LDGASEAVVGAGGGPEGLALAAWQADGILRRQATTEARVNVMGVDLR
jgi:alkanesulfonate monooxygenase SsuD/methylene tetrahydromethanopterin reductase-like flavin-dependent oxidoreductase (luciferase family)